MKTNTEFYAVAHHGTGGLGNSYGPAYVREYHPDMYGGRPQSDHTTTVWGPYTQEKAEMEVAKMNALCYRFVLERDIAQYNYELAETNMLIEDLNRRIVHLRDKFPDEDPSEFLGQLAENKAVVEYFNSRIEEIQAKIRAI